MDHWKDEAALRILAGLLAAGQPSGQAIAAAISATDAFADAACRAWGHDYSGQETFSTCHRCGWEHGSDR